MAAAGALRLEHLLHLTGGHPHAQRRLQRMLPAAAAMAGTGGPTGVLRHCPGPPAVKTVQDSMSATMIDDWQRRASPRYGTAAPVHCRISAAHAAGRQAVQFELYLHVKDCYKKMQHACCSAARASEWHAWSCPAADSECSLRTSALPNGLISAEGHGCWYNGTFHMLIGGVDSSSAT
jgi:hypothetical protein